MRMAAASIGKLVVMAIFVMPCSAEEKVYTMEILKIAKPAKEI